MMMMMMMVMIVMVMIMIIIRAIHMIVTTTEKRYSQLLEFCKRNPCLRWSLCLPRSSGCEKSLCCIVINSAQIHASKDFRVVKTHLNVCTYREEHSFIMDKLRIHVQSKEDVAHNIYAKEVM